MLLANTLNIPLNLTLTTLEQPMNLTNRTLSIFTAASLLISGSAFSAESTLKEKVQAAMTNDIRQTSDTERDENRKPLETV